MQSLQESSWTSKKATRKYESRELTTSGSEGLIQLNGSRVKIYYNKLGIGVICSNMQSNDLPWTALYVGYGNYASGL